MRNIVVFGKYMIGTIGVIEIENLLVKKALGRSLSEK